MNRIDTVNPVKVSALALAALAGCCTPALGVVAPGIEIVGMTGTPTANGVMGEMGYHSTINSSGLVASYTICTGTANGDRDNQLVFRGVPGAHVEIARSGSVAPDANGFLQTPLGYGLNDSGLVCGSWFFSAAANNADFGALSGSGGAPSQIARRGQPVPGGNGVFFQPQFSTPMPDNSIIFWSSIENGVPESQTGIFRNVSGVNLTIARTGQLAPGGPGTYKSLGYGMDVNPSGQIAFASSLDGALDQYTDSGHFRTDGVSTIAIAREGQIMPDGNGQIYSALGAGHTPTIGLDGTVAFFTDTLGTLAYPADEYAVVFGNGGALKLALRSYQPAPDGNGRFGTPGFPSVLSDGRVILGADIYGSANPGTDDGGLYICDGTTVSTVFRNGAPAASGAGTLAAGGWTLVDLNSHDDMAMLVEIRNAPPGTLPDAVYTKRQNQPWVEIIREGDSFLGGTVAELDIAGQGTGPESHAINDSGQVVFRVQLADGRSAVARYTPPPACPGDFNSDGQRNTNDLTLFLSQFGHNVSLWGIGDMNGDGVVNTNDLTAFLAVFGQACR